MTTLKHDVRILLSLSVWLIVLTGEWRGVVIQASDGGPPLADARNVKQARKEAAKRARRLITNNDGNDCLTPPLEPHTRENFLSKRTSPLAGTHVDAIFYCSGVFNLYTQHSRETELRQHSDFGSSVYKCEPLVL